APLSLSTPRSFPSNVFLAQAFDPLVDPKLLFRQQVQPVNLVVHPNPDPHLLEELRKFFEERPQTKPVYLSSSSASMKEFFKQLNAQLKILELPKALRLSWLDQMRTCALYLSDSLGCRKPELIFRTMESTGARHWHVDGDYHEPGCVEEDGKIRLRLLVTYTGQSGTEFVAEDNIIDKTLVESGKHEPTEVLHRPSEVYAADIGDICLMRCMLPHGLVHRSPTGDGSRFILLGRAKER
ncbi:MAG: DUF1826 domain-containing protein, partial [Bdellovibrionales bacterium]|nr:DUF1826 domain-containing protein [Bdellovibrionales bacterium]